MQKKKKTSKSVSGDTQKKENLLKDINAVVTEYMKWKTINCTLINGMIKLNISKNKST